MAEFMGAFLDGYKSVGRKGQKHPDDRKSRSRSQAPPSDSEPDSESTFPEESDSERVPPGLTRDWTIRGVSMLDDERKNEEDRKKNKEDKRKKQKKEAEKKKKKKQDDKKKEKPTGLFSSFSWTYPQEEPDPKPEDAE
jgi:hypothetical protein